MQPPPTILKTDTLDTGSTEINSEPSKYSPAQKQMSLERKIVHSKNLSIKVCSLPELRCPLSHLYKAQTAPMMTVTAAHCSKESMPIHPTLTKKTDSIPVVQLLPAGQLKDNTGQLTNFMNRHSMAGINVVRAETQTRQAQQKSLIAGIFMPVENSLHDDSTVICGGGYGVETGNKRVAPVNTSPTTSDRRKPAVTTLIEAIAVTTNDGFINVVMEAVMPTITISSKEIREHNGLFNLNDLHKASGGEQKNQPYKFIRLAQTSELIEEIVKSPDLASLKNEDRRSAALKRVQGCKGGTYVCKELIYAYAMWISPKFHLAVIRAFDKIQTQQANPSETPDNSQQLALPDPNQTITIVTTIEAGKPPRSATYQGKVALVPCDALVELDKQMTRLHRDHMFAQEKIMLDMHEKVITARSTPANTLSLKETA